MPDSRVAEDPWSTSKVMELTPPEIQQGPGTPPTEGDVGSEKEYQPIKSRSRDQDGVNPRHGGRSRSSSIRSYGDGHGFACVGPDVKAPSTGNEDGRVSEKAFEVQWDGDNDPMNPRSMGRARKWVIVLIVSASSLCVYVRFLTVIIIKSQPSELMLIAPSTCTSSLYTSTYSQIIPVRISPF